MSTEKTTTTESTVCSAHLMMMFLQIPKNCVVKSQIHRTPNCLQNFHISGFLEKMSRPAPYIKMRTTASPTADMDTRVPMQYLITSYFAASSWALKAWISWNPTGKDRKHLRLRITEKYFFILHFSSLKNVKTKKRMCIIILKIKLENYDILLSSLKLNGAKSSENATTILTRSSLFVRLVVSAFWLANSSRIRLENDEIVEKRQNADIICMELKNNNLQQKGYSRSLRLLTLFQDLNPIVAQQLLCQSRIW